MIRIKLPAISGVNISTDDLICSGLDVISSQFMPDIVDGIENYVSTYSSAIVNRHNNEILGLIVVSSINLECIDSQGIGCLVSGCGITNNINCEIRDYVINQLISRVGFLFWMGRNDDNTLATNYYCLQPNTEEECEEIMTSYGMTKHSYNNYTILSKPNNGSSINLGFLKRYFK